MSDTITTIEAIIAILVITSIIFAGTIGLDWLNDPNKHLYFTKKRAIQQKKEKEWLQLSIGARMLLSESKYHTHNNCDCNSFTYNLAKSFATSDFKKIASGTSIEEIDMLEPERLKSTVLRYYLNDVTDSEWHLITEEYDSHLSKFLSEDNEFMNTVESLRTDNNRRHKRLSYVKEAREEVSGDDIAAKNWDNRFLSQPVV